MQQLSRLARSACLVPLMAFGLPATAQAVFSQFTPDKTTVLIALSQGLHIESLAACGLSPSEIGTVLNLLADHENRLSELSAASETYKVALRRQHAAERAVQRLGDAEGLESEISSAISDVAQATSTLEAVRQAFAAEFAASLEDILDTQRRDWVINSIANAQWDVPVSMRVIPSNAANWMALQSAHRAIRANGLDELTPQQAAVWSAVMQRPDVVAAEQNRQVGASALASAFAAYFSQLPN